jgi:hypothetical protein
MKLTVHPLTPDVWPAFEDLFSDSNVCQSVLVYVMEDWRRLPKAAGNDEQGGISGDRRAWSTAGPARL